MKKLLFALVLFGISKTGFSQTDSSQYLAALRVMNRIVVDFGDGKKWVKLNEVYPDLELKSDSDIEMIVRLKKKGWDFIAILPPQPGGAFSQLENILLFRRK